MTMASDGKRFKVLFLCTGNSARSILGEYLLRRIGRDRFETYSAGTFPTGKVNPFAIRVLQDFYDIDATDARSKPTSEYEDVDFDFVITVCDNARETCPVWPGRPLVAHWGIPDPALATGSDDEILHEFKQAAQRLQRQIDQFCALPLEKMNRAAIEKLTSDIGRPS